MLLKEIIQTDYREINAHNRKFNYQTNTYFNTRGVGMFANVRQHPKDPHMVQKCQKMTDDTKSDAYPIFVRVLLDSDQKENPFFPRIYSVKRYSDADEATLHKFEMEKLIEGNVLRPKQIVSIAEILFDEEFNEDYKITTVTILAQAIRSLCKAPYLLAHVNDNNLKSAIVFINRLVKNGLQLDMHDKNIMFRRAAHGIQLVITDPVRKY